jgi:hypothetical protein
LPPSFRNINLKEHETTNKLDIIIIIISTIFTLIRVHCSTSPSTLAQKENSRSHFHDGVLLVVGSL